jgi:hypothetical protein
MYQPHSTYAPAQFTFPRARNPMTTTQRVVAIGGALLTAGVVAAIFFWPKSASAATLPSGGDDKPDPKPDPKKPDPKKPDPKKVDPPPPPPPAQDIVEERNRPPAAAGIPRLVAEWLDEDGRTKVLANLDFYARTVAAQAYPTWKWPFDASTPKWMKDVLQEAGDEFNRQANTGGEIETVELPDLNEPPPPQLPAPSVPPRNWEDFILGQTRGCPGAPSEVLADEIFFYFWPKAPDPIPNTELGRLYAAQWRKIHDTVRIGLTEACR